MKREYRYKPGDMIPGSRLRVVRPVGYGGMGTIYECEQTLTGLRYVVKVIHPELLAGKGMLARMEQEARVLAQLRHPNIVQIFWADMTNEDPPLFYYVMEKLDGYTLRRLQHNAVSRGVPLRMDFILRSMESLLNALAHAHSYGMIHRDVKPDNIFVHTGEIIKLLDWGIAAVRGKRRTTSRGFVGTLGYGAPEQFLGGQPTSATDIWAVGVICYELAAGREPFGGEATEFATAQAILSKTPVPPSTFRPEIPPALDALILQMLEKEPTKRPSDALSVASELEKIRKALLAQELPLPELMGLELMEGMGPPSITNVEEDFEEEEEPPPSAQADAIAAAPAASKPAEGAAAPLPYSDTDVLTASAVDRAIGRPVVPAPPPLPSTPAQRTLESPKASGEAQPRPQSGSDRPSRPSSQISVPWARALRALEGSTTIRRAPLPETLALSNRDAMTPALGVAPRAIRGQTEVLQPAPPPLHAAPHIAVARTEPIASQAAPAPIATEVPSRPYSQTDFQPFKEAPIVELGPVAEAPKGADLPFHPARPAKPEAKAAPDATPAAERRGLRSEHAEPAVRQRPPPVPHAAATPLAQAEPRPAATALSHQDAACHAPAAGAGPVLSTGARCRPAPAKDSPAPLATRPLLDWGAAGTPAVQLPAVQPDEVESQASAVRTVTSAPAVSTVPWPFATGVARRVLVVFAVSLVSGLSVFGGIAAIYLYRTPGRFMGPAASSLEVSAAPIALGGAAPSAAASSEERAGNERLAAELPPASPVASGAANPPAPLGRPSGSSAPGELERPATAPPDPPESPKELVAANPPVSSASTTPRSKVSRQHAPASQKPFRDLPFHVSGTDTVPSSDEEPFGAAFLSRGKPTASPAPARPRPAATVPSRGAQ